MSKMIKRKILEKTRLKSQMRTSPIVIKTTHATTEWCTLIKQSIKEFWPIILKITDPQLRDYIKTACIQFNPRNPTNAQMTAVQALANPNTNRKLKESIIQLERDIIASTDNKDPTRWIEFHLNLNNQRNRAVIEAHAYQLEKLNQGWYSIPEPTIDGRNMGIKLAISQHAIDRITTRFIEHDHINLSLKWMHNLILLSTPEHDRYHIVFPTYQDNPLIRSILRSLYGDLAPFPIGNKLEIIKPYIKIGSLIIQPNNNKFKRHLTCRTYLIPTSRTAFGTKSSKVNKNTVFSELNICPQDLHQLYESIAFIDNKGYLYQAKESSLEQTKIKLNVTL